MHGIANSPVSLGRMMPEQAASMQKLLSSQTFATSPRLREVLSHLVQTLANGTTDQVNEQSVGQEVFGRPAGYNASEDNIVRVTIRHLRTRLEEYYKTEGVNDPWVLNIPKGKYVPLLEPATNKPAPPSVPVPTAMDAISSGTQAGARTTSHSARPLHLGIAALAILLAGVTGGYLLHNSRKPPLPSGGILGQLCGVGEDMTVVLVDSNLQAYRQIFHQQVSLDDYIHRSYAKEALEGIDPRLTDARQFSLGSNETNVSSGIVAAALRETLPGRHIAIKHPHDVSVREFQDQKSVILLGGPFINPWGQLFEDRFNFRLLPAPNAPASSEIHNLKPQPGEAGDYIPHVEGNLRVNYVRIAILPNFQNSGHVVLMGATSPEALEEAGTYLLSDEAVTEVETLFHSHTVQNLSPLEFVLEVRGLNAVPNSHRIISSRIVKSSSDR
jgi:hypothetical protein